MKMTGVFPMLCIGRVSPGKLAASFQTPAGIHASCARRSIVLRLLSAAPIPDAAWLTSLSLTDRPVGTRNQRKTMRYQLALEIHERIGEVLRLIKTGEYSTPALAEAVGVSIPTISRIVAALREQGHEIKAVRAASGWRYELVKQPQQTKHASRGTSSERIA